MTNAAARDKFQDLNPRQLTVVDMLTGSDDADAHLAPVTQRGQVIWYAVRGANGRVLDSAAWGLKIHVTLTPAEYIMLKYEGFVGEDGRLA